MELIKPNTKIDFMGNRYYAYAFTTIVMIISLISIPIKGFINLGIDFTGGVSVQLKFNKPVDTEQIRQMLKPISENVTVQKFASGAGSTSEDYVVRLEILDEAGEKLQLRLLEAIEAQMGKGAVEIRGLEMVGPKVGKDLRQHAVWATVIALSLLLVYMGFRFTFTMGLGAVICLVHDLIAMYGFMVWTGKEFNLTILAAMLTIIGYDVNDTIVVCDRIRDNLKVMRKQPLIDVFNLSINQTLSRTLLTSSFTMLVVIALLVVGSSVLRDFAWALLVGIIFGTYSSIFVASPLVLELDRIFPVRKSGT